MRGPVDCDTYPDRREGDVDLHRPSGRVEEVVGASGLPELGGQPGADNWRGGSATTPARAAAGVGFEPTVGCPTAVFKTAALGH